jgi:hypothetical protein
LRVLSPLHAGKASRLTDGKLPIGAQFKIIGAVFCRSGEFGAKDEIADRDLRTIRIIALIRALYNGAEEPRLSAYFSCAFVPEAPT